MSYQFAWAAMAGVSYQIMPHVLLDAGYRYLSLGTFHSTSIATGGPQSQKVNAQEFRVGLRYMID
jgi:opacity protein-like surface antigen